MQTQESSTKLVVRVAGNQAREFEIAKSSVSIGRSTTNDIALHDPKVSRMHALVECHKNEWRVVDLGATNGKLGGG